MNSNKDLDLYKSLCLDGHAEPRTQYIAFMPVHLTKRLWLFEDY